jgi:hypothetical protein
MSGYEVRFNALTQDGGAEKPVLPASMTKAVGMIIIHGRSVGIKKEKYQLEEICHDKRKIRLSLQG